MTSDCSPQYWKLGGFYISLPFLPLLTIALGRSWAPGAMWGTLGTQGLYSNSQLSVLVCAAWMSALLVKIGSRFSRVLCPSLFWSRILALAGQLSRMKILASDQRIFFFSFRAKPTGPQQFQPPLWLHWPHAERAEPTGLCRQLLALPRPDLSPLEIFIVITLVFHHYQALGYVAGSWTLWVGRHTSLDGLTWVKVLQLCAPPLRSVWLFGTPWTAGGFLVLHCLLEFAQIHVH